MTVPFRDWWKEYNERMNLSDLKREMTFHRHCPHCGATMEESWYCAEHRTMVYWCNIVECGHQIWHLGPGQGGKLAEGAHEHVAATAEESLIPPMPDVSERG